MPNLLDYWNRFCRLPTITQEPAPPITYPVQDSEIRPLLESAMKDADSLIKDVHRT